MQSYKYTIFRTCKTMAIFALGRKIVDEKGNLRRLFEKHHLFHDLGNEFSIPLRQHSHIVDVAAWRVPCSVVNIYPL